MERKDKNYKKIHEMMDAIEAGPEDPEQQEVARPLEGLGKKEFQHSADVIVRELAYSTNDGYKQLVNASAEFHEVDGTKLHVAIAPASEEGRRAWMQDKERHGRVTLYGRFSNGDRKGQEFPLYRIDAKTGQVYKADLDTLDRKGNPTFTAISMDSAASFDQLSEAKAMLWFVGAEASDNAENQAQQAREALEENQAELEDLEAYLNRQNFYHELDSLLGYFDVAFSEGDQDTPDQDKKRMQALTKIVRGTNIDVEDVDALRRLREDVKRYDALAQVRSQARKYSADAANLNHVRQELG